MSWCVACSVGVFYWKYPIVMPVDLKRRETNLCLISIDQKFVRLISHLSVHLYHVRLIGDICLAYYFCIGTSSQVTKRRINNRIIGSAASDVQLLPRLRWERERERKCDFFDWRRSMENQSIHWWRTIRIDDDEVWSRRRNKHDQCSREEVQHVFDRDGDVHRIWHFTRSVASSDHHHHWSVPCEWDGK
jgi:hypothetical protein